MQEIVAFPIALQHKMLAIRRYLDARHGWLFGEGQRMVETNSLQLVKMLAASGRYVALTSQLDAAAEIIAGTLKFIPVRDKGAEPQPSASQSMPESRSRKSPGSSPINWPRAWMRICRG